MTVEAQNDASFMKTEECYLPLPIYVSYPLWHVHISISNKQHARLLEYHLFQVDNKWPLLYPFQIPYFALKWLSLKGLAQHDTLQFCAAGLRLSAVCFSTAFFCYISDEKVRWMIDFFSYRKLFVFFKYQHAHRIHTGESIDFSLIFGHSLSHLFICAGVRVVLYTPTWDISHIYFRGICWFNAGCISIVLLS